MKTNTLENALFMPRETADRRVSVKAELPYLTEEGLILFDRREGGDRRAAQRPQVNACTGTVSHVADPVKLAA
jgi:hypothetical protein